MLFSLSLTVSITAIKEILILVYTLDLLYSFIIKHKIYFFLKDIIKSYGINFPVLQH